MKFECLCMRYGWHQGFLNANERPSKIGNADKHHNFFLYDEQKIK